MQWKDSPDCSAIHIHKWIIKININRGYVINMIKQPNSLRNMQRYSLSWGIRKKKTEKKKKVTSVEFVAMGTVIVYSDTSLFTSFY